MSSTFLTSVVCVIKVLSEILVTKAFSSWADDPLLLWSPFNGCPLYSLALSTDTNSNVI